MINITATWAIFGFFVVVFIVVILLLTNVIKVDLFAENKPNGMWYILATIISGLISVGMIIQEGSKLVSPLSYV